MFSVLFTYQKDTGREPITAAGAISIRDVRFSTGGSLVRWYIAGDPVQSGFFSALSSTFPLGERFFMDSVRVHGENAPEALKRDITDFIGQEALHTREHVAFNNLVARAGYETSNLFVRVRGVLARYDRRSALRRLGLTLALEHFTALLAYEVLTRPELLEHAPAEVRGLWRWHAAEEIEHKGVAFDTFLWTCRGRSAGSRYLLRVQAMLEATVVLFSVVGRNMHDLFRQDELPSARTWAAALKYLIGPGGVLPPMAKGYLAWFRPGFHPWQHDDRALADRELAGFAPTAAPLAA